MGRETGDIPNLLTADRPPFCPCDVDGQTWQTPLQHTHTQTGRQEDKETCKHIQACPQATKIYSHANLHVHAQTPSTQGSRSRHPTKHHHFHSSGHTFRSIPHVCRGQKRKIRNATHKKRKQVQLAMYTNHPHRAASQASSPPRGRPLRRAGRGGSGRRGRTAGPRGGG